MSLREHLLAEPDGKPDPLVIPELNGLQVWLRRMSAAEALELGAQFRLLPQERTGAVARERAALSLRAFLCEEDGSQALPTIEDARLMVDRRTMHVVQRIIEAGERLNALGESAPQDLQKN